MKKITLFLFTLLLFVSCNNDNHFSGYYEEDYEDTVYVDTIKIEKPQRLIYYLEPPFCTSIESRLNAKDTMITINCYNDGFSINGIRYNAEEVKLMKDIDFFLPILLINVTSEETGEYYPYVNMDTYSDGTLLAMVFKDEDFKDIKGFCDEMYSY